MELEEGDVVLCTVDRIIGTTVFVNIKGNGEGSINFSEVAPGRIRNIRSYVVPKKKIVCKVLRISKGRIELSLRRVTLKEKKEVLERDKQEKSYENMLKSILKEKADKDIEKIKKEQKLFDFFQEARKNPKKVEKIFGKKDSEKILEILKSQKPKKTIVKKFIKFISKSQNGISDIKNILKHPKEIKIKYISSGKYSLKTEAENPKKADQRLQKFLKTIEKKAKKNNIKFSILKK